MQTYTSAVRWLSVGGFFSLFHPNPAAIVLVPVSGSGRPKTYPAMRFLSLLMFACMIVVPMLIQTVTFGPILTNLLGDDPGNAITFAGILLAVAAAAMTWIKEPPIVRDVDAVLAMPAGAH